MVGTNLSPDGRIRNSPAFQDSLKIVDQVQQDKKSCHYGQERKLLAQLKPSFSELKLPSIEEFTKDMSESIQQKAKEARDQLQYMKKLKEMGLYEEKTP